MKFTEEMSGVIKESPYLTIVTINENGTPHPIIVGGKELKEESVAIGIYKMEITQANLARDNRAWIVAATMNGKPKGFRFCGTAVTVDKKVVFTPDSAEVMI